jgi:hypothetical protein
MNMIGQYHQRIDKERPLIPAIPNCLPQTIQRPIICQNASPPFATTVKKNDPPGK